MNRRRVTLAAILVLAAGVVPSGAAATSPAPEEVAALSGDLPAAPGMVTQRDLEDPGSPALAPWPELRGGLDASALLAGLADMTRRSPLEERTPIVSSAGAAEEEGSIGDAFPAGDLDGDGWDDVLLLDVAIEGAVATFRALDGSDGSVLWSRVPGPAAFAYWLPREDLTGDGATDLLALDLLAFDSEERDCSEPTVSCTEWTTEFRWSVSVVSGRTGASAWVHTDEGSATYRESTSIGLGESTSEVRYVLTNGFMLPELSVSPAGWSVVAATADFQWTEVEHHEGVPGILGTHETSRTVEETVTVNLHDAVTGTIDRHFALGPADTVTFVYPTHDLDGDGSAEILRLRDTDLNFTETCQYVLLDVACEGGGPEPGSDLAVLDGSSLEPWWTREYDETVWWSSGLGVDVDGDGVEDLTTLLIDYHAPGSTRAVMTGADGVTLHTDSDGLGFVGVADLDADGLDDLLRVRTDENWDLVAIDRVRGIDGTVLFGTEHHREYSDDPVFDEFWYLYLARDDYDGDDLADHVVGWLRYRADDEGYVYPHSSTLAVESMTGALLWHAEFPDEAMAFRAGQVDADDAPDFLLSPIYLAGPASPPRVYLVTGADGEVLWQREPDTTFASGAAIGRMDEVAGDDVVVYHDVDEDGRPSTVFEALNGATAATLWNARSQP